MVVLIVKPHESHDYDEHAEDKHDPQSKFQVVR